MQEKLLLVLGLVAILAFESGDCWWRRRHSYHNAYKSHHLNTLKLYRALQSKYRVVLANYKALVSYIHGVGVRAVRYGGYVTGIGRQLLSQHARHRYIAYHYGDDDLVDDDLFSDNMNDAIEDNFNEENDDQHLFEEKEEKQENGLPQHAGDFVREV
uniref:uncharacterized protein LOC120341431 n=1 Tax=Styela clava TaxID=7725 RepID=UPI00193A090A|nr:uncharacterized protein LOC120341431 [Styela clava]